MDITLDFHSIASQQQNRLHKKKKEKITNNNKDNNNFKQLALHLSKQLSQIDTNITKLLALVTSFSLFQDPTQQIETLSYNIKNELYNSNQQLISLKEISQLSPLSFSLSSFSSSQLSKHNAIVVLDLYSKYTETKQKFDRSISLWAENVKKRERKAEMLIGRKSTINNLPVSNMNYDGEVSIFMPQLALQEYNYEATRAAEIEKLEKPLVEISLMFADILKLLSIQENSLQRIDDNLDIATINTDKGEQALLKYMKNISGNRRLIAKLFSVLVFFVIVVVVVL